MRPRSAAPAAEGRSAQDMSDTYHRHQYRPLGPLRMRFSRRNVRSQSRLPVTLQSISLWPLTKWKATPPCYLRREGLQSMQKKDYPAAVLLAAMVLASLAPVLLLGAFLLFQYVSKERAAALERVNALAGAISATLDREFWGRIETLQALAAKRHLDEAELGQFADILRAASSVSTGDFVLIDEAGNQHINTRSEVSALPAQVPDPTELPLVLKNGGARVSDLFQDMTNGSYRFAIRIPITGNSGARYVFGYVPRNDKVLGVLRESSLPQGWFAAVLDRKGRIVARSSRNEDFAGKPASPDFFASLTRTHGQMESVDLEGRETVSSYQRSPLSEWVTSYGCPSRCSNRALICV